MKYRELTPNEIEAYQVGYKVGARQIIIADIEFESPEEKKLYRKGYNAGCQDILRSNVSNVSNVLKNTEIQQNLVSNVSNVSNVKPVIVNTIVDNNNIVKENIPSNWNTRVAPTEDEVLEYARQQNDMAGMGGFAVTEQQAQDFYDHYSGVGWCLTNDAQTPIRDWRPLLRKWVRNPRFVSTPVKDANDDAYEADLRFFAHRKRDRELEQQKRKEANK